jgi:hypothetical protein
MQNRAASPARESYESTTQAIELTGARWAFKPAMAARPRVLCTTLLGGAAAAWPHAAAGSHAADRNDD